MNTDKPILKELNQRKSVRRFLEKNIEPEKLEALWTAAQWAPSSSNKQEWHYYAATGAARGIFAEILNPGNSWALNAPLIIAATRDSSIEDKTESREYGVYNVGLSVMSLVIEAEHQGLRCCQMAGFKEEPFRRLLKIPDQEIPVVIIAIGYESPAEPTDPVVAEKEKRPRQRKSIADMVTFIEDDESANRKL